MLDWIWMFLIGIVIGALARFIMPGAQPMGLFRTGLYGVGGSLLAGFVISTLMGVPFMRGGFIASVIGALALLWVMSRIHKSA